MNASVRMGSARGGYASRQQTGRAKAPYAWCKGEVDMNIARIAGAAAIAAAGALATAGASQAAPALALGADTVDTAKSAATPVHHYGYYHSGYYGTYYQPHYAPYGYAPPPPPPRYYAPYPYGYRHGYYGYRPRPHGGLFIRTPGVRLGIGW
jgi:hypothetical protein